MPIITISREAGSFGDELAERLSERCGHPLMDFDQMVDKFLKPIATEHEKQMLEVSAKYFFEPITTDQHVNFKAYLEGSIQEWAENNRAILLGCGGNYLLKDHPKAIHVRVTAPLEVREQRISGSQEQYRNYLKYQAQDKDFHYSIDQLHELKFMEKFISSKEISTISESDLTLRIDRQYRRFISTLFQADDSTFEPFHIVLNTGKLSLDACLAVLESLIEDYRISLYLELQGQSDRTVLQNNDLPDFKNESEKEFAKLLNLYQIDWRYEPKFFPVEWDDENRVTMAFSPDFYLPKFDLYLELTTMNQRYVSAKRKKLEKLQELYPGVNVKIIYRRDFESLVKRFE
ncbi:MAG: cytidylate kinase-like family protein [Clostridiaceae bacterium]|nr:cytidylate kinase family protein [Bacillota bacterium]NLN51820.1 cytidylate kinase-like family protein [Clostridiaceae bacterium]